MNLRPSCKVGARTLAEFVVLAASLAFAPNALAGEPGQSAGTVTNLKVR